MAPSTMVFDYRGQIIGKYLANHNCEFFLAKHDVVSVVTVKHVLGDFKAYAIRSNQSSREALLSSDSRSTPLLAVESLHTKSCEAVQQFINTNGFSYPPDLKKTRFDDDDDEDDDDEDEDEEDGNDEDDIAPIFSNLLSDHPAPPTAATSYRSSSDGEVKMTPASSTVPITHGREVRDERSNNISKPRTNPPPPPPPPGRQSPEALIFPNTKPPYTLSQAEELVMELINGPLSICLPRGSGPPPPPQPTYSSTTPAPRPQPASASASVPVPVPAPVPSWPPASRGMSAPPVNYPPAHLRSMHPPRQQANNNNFPSMVVPPPPPPPPPPSQLSQHPRGHPVIAAAAAANPRLYDIALTIRWLGHGEARVLASCRASVQALKSTAVTYVTRYASAFDRDGSPPNRNGSGHGSGSGNGNGNNAKWQGTVRLRRASIRNLHGEEYDLNMELYQEDDLTRFCGGRGIPRFEVEVEDQAEEGERAKARAI
ncbi:uncharacterized protein F4812DRAFT_451478 [Daldinia caldariorum]|uniref:uncharacterized protein n=1 Tax=Daldinia caldariorum TaxID=326644 RepID=UPI002008E3AB|nr:uncharacterized protein F4812DRAFT_451478 [Daldinia caldariorum]KAI1467162.1 hypothetical protein F4812DRAFT_451478 [Daldinia caldariorum]